MLGAETIHVQLWGTDKGGKSFENKGRPLYLTIDPVEWRSFEMAGIEGMNDPPTNTKLFELPVNTMFLKDVVHHTYEEVSHTKKPWSR